MTRSEYVALIEPFVARLSATAVRIETATQPAFSPRARERNGMGAPGIKVSWALTLTVDGEPIEDEMFTTEFGGWFRTKGEATAADWQTFVEAMLVDCYFDVIDYPESVTGLVQALMEETE